MRVGGVLAGFVFGTVDARRLLRAVMLRRGLELALRTAWTGLIRPHLLGLVWPTLRYLGQGRDNRPRAELLSIAVREGFRKHRCGTRLVAAFNEGCRARGVTEYRVGVYVQKGGADTFYTQLGFELERSFAMGPRPWHSYRYRIRE
jgi:GNAT superfamily N-acetyltransferase